MAIPKNRISIYQVYPRAYGPHGTFSDITEDIPRIAAMGFDFLYLLPIHPIGRKGRKGSLGSPYSIADYYGINPEYGTLQDFDHLLSAAHAAGLRVMMDIVLNHSANDNRWTETHPQYYLHDADGQLVRKVADWSDICDFDTTCPALKEEIARMLLYWADRGVDGFRCDVASLVPYPFWEHAFSVVNARHPDTVWLAESVHMELLQACRRQGNAVTSDSELASLFHLLYPYDLFHVFRGALQKDLAPYASFLNFVYSEYPRHARKLMCLENHDQPRIASLLGQDQYRIDNWLAFSFCYDGAAFVYAGQEAHAVHLPSLFEREPIDWSLRDPSYERYIAGLNRIHHAILPQVEECEVFVCHGLLCLLLFSADTAHLGLFNLNGISEIVTVPFSLDSLCNLIDGTNVDLHSVALSPESLPLLAEIPKATAVEIAEKYLRFSAEALE